MAHLDELSVQKLRVDSREYGRKGIHMCVGELRFNKRLHHPLQYAGACLNLALVEQVVYTLSLFVGLQPAVLEGMQAVLA